MHFRAFSFLILLMVSKLAGAQTFTGENINDVKAALIGTYELEIPNALWEAPTFTLNLNEEGELVATSPDGTEMAAVVVFPKGLEINPIPVVSVVIATDGGDGATNMITRITVKSDGTAMFPQVLDVLYSWNFFGTNEIGHKVYTAPKTAITPIR